MRVCCLLRCLLVVLLPFAATEATAAGMGVDDARHFLNRVGFGASPEQITEFAQLSREHAISKVLASTTAQVHAAAPADVSVYLPLSQIRAQRQQSEAAKKEAQREQVRRGLMLRAWWVEEMLAADTPALQLRERMVLFWHNHFVSSIAKVKSSAVMLEQNQLFRTHALGHFDVLLHAVAKNPAMVVYLDSASNRKGSPNENFAREVMELFTLGEGHYSEQDIKEAARAYTGWSVDPERGTFKWRAFAHDEGEKTVLGQRGNFEGDAVLDILLAQPQTAEFVLNKLWCEFISPQADYVEVQRIAKLWRKSGYDIRVALGGLLRSPAFWAPQNRGVLTKSPVELVVGTLHTFDVRVDDGLPFAFVLGQLGQDLFAPPNVKGWPGGEAWINSQTLLLRKQFIERLLRSEHRMGSAASAGGADMNDDTLRQRAKRSLADVHLDTRQWLQRVSAAGLRPEQVLFAMPAAGTEVGDVHSLLLDVLYQVR